MKTIHGLVLCLLCGLVSGPAWATNKGEDIVVAPKVLVLKKQSTGQITVHANVPLCAVVADSVRLFIVDDLDAFDPASAGLVPSSVFADDCGDLVAKFDLAVVKDLLCPGEVTFVLAWDDETGPCLGSDTVKVR